MCIYLFIYETLFKKYSMRLNCINKLLIIFILSEHIQFLPFIQQINAENVLFSAFIC